MKNFKTYVSIQDISLLGLTISANRSYDKLQETYQVIFIFSGASTIYTSKEDSY